MTEKKKLQTNKKKDFNFTFEDVDVGYLISYKEKTFAATNMDDVAMIIKKIIYNSYENK